MSFRDFMLMATIMLAVFIGTTIIITSEHEKTRKACTMEITK